MTVVDPSFPPSSDGSERLLLGALGGPVTFGGEAADLFVEAYPMFADVSYFETADAMFAAVDDGTISAACVPEQTATAGFHERSQRRLAVPSSPYVVLAEVAHAYRCSLLARPGSSLEDIRQVLGHTGSIAQSRGWLMEHLPAAEIDTVDSNSLGAAQLVAGADGSVASVGTRSAARETGLVELARDIDGGSVGNYWAVGRELRIPEAPTRWVVAGRWGEQNHVGRLVAALDAQGLDLLTAYSVPSGHLLFEYDYVFRFAGSAAPAAVSTALAQHPAARLAGCFVAV